MHQNGAIGIVLVSLLLTLNIFHTLFYCFYCKLLAGKSGLDKLCAQSRSGAHILHCEKEKKWLDLQISNQIDQTMKKLQWISNTIVNTTTLFDNVYIFDNVKIDLSTLSLINIWLIVCISTGKRCYRALQISSMRSFEKKLPTLM